MISSLAMVLPAQSGGDLGMVFCAERQARGPALPLMGGVPPGGESG
jgi:hypothetical protein